MKRLVLGVQLFCVGLISAVLVACNPVQTRAENPTTAPTATTTRFVLPAEPAENTAVFSPTPLVVAESTSVTITSTMTVAAETAVPAATPLLTPTTIPLMVNRLTLDQFLIMPPETVAHAREIFANGQVWGRNPARFSKLGDSLIATPAFLTVFDEPGHYNLGEYTYLQPTIEYFTGSFKRYGVAVRAGLHAWGVFDPLWANKEWCEANENLLDCELRLYNPTILLILLGSNDNGSALAFDKNIRQVVETCIANGVIPVLATKADRFEGLDDRNNTMIRQIATEYQVPLWDFDAIANTLPNRGLGEDAVHLTTFPESDYTLPAAFERGYAIHNLTALMMLDMLRQQVILGE